MDTIQCINNYIEERYGGGLIKVSDVAKYRGVSQGKVIAALTIMERSGEVKIETRYSCPHFHFVRQSEIPYCSDCNQEYSEEELNVYVYFKPLKPLVTY